MDTHKNAPLTPTAAINTLTTDRKGAAWQEVDSGSTIARCRSTGPAATQHPAPCSDGTTMFPSTHAPKFNA